MTKLRTTWFPLLALAALLAVASVSCGPSGNVTPPPDGDLEVRIIVDGPGRVIADSSPHECRDDCLWTGDSSVDTRFEAVPAPGYVFVAWAGACDAFENPCIRRFQNGDTITATFAPHALRLRLTGDGEGEFRIQSPPIDVGCTEDCAVGLPQPLSLAITHFGSAEALRETVREWGGACAGVAPSSRQCLVPVNGSTDVNMTWRHPPVAVDDTYGTARNATLSVSAGQGVLANDDDTPGDTLTAELVTDATQGTLTLAANGGFTYTPEPDFTGPATFTYRARDAFGSVSNPATVTITVTQVNRPPVANDDVYATEVNTQLVVPAPGVLANDTDPDGDTLTAQLVVGVGHGLLVLAADGSFTYEPDDDFTSTDTFTYVANDGIANSNTAKVTITVSKGAPIAVDDSYYTVRDSTLRRDAGQGVLANDIGFDLTAFLVDDVDEGDLTLNADGSFTYDSDDDFVGDDIFTYHARDPFGTVSNIGTVTITVLRR